MINKNLLFRIIFFLTIINIVACKEQGSSYLSFRNPSDQTMINLHYAYLHLRATKDTATIVGVHYAKVEDTIYNIVDSVQILKFGHCYAWNKENPTLLNASYTTHTISEFQIDTLGKLAFYSELTDVHLDTTYYVRSYAIIKYKNSGFIDTAYNQTVSKFHTKIPSDIWLHYPDIDYNGDGRTGATVVVFKNRAYIIGGYDQSQLLNTVLEYSTEDDPATPDVVEGGWRQVSSITNSPGSMEGAAFVINDTIYYGTGIIDVATNAKTNKIYAWNPPGILGSYNNWTEIDTMPNALSGAVGFTLTDKYGKKIGHIAFGNINYAQNAIYAFDPIYKTWNQIYVDDKGRDNPVIGYMDNYVIVGGGTDENGNILNDFMMIYYNQSNDLYLDKKGNCPCPERAKAVGVALSFIKDNQTYKYFYYGTGIDKTGKLYNDWWRYDIKLKNWEEVSMMHADLDTAAPRYGAIGFSLIRPNTEFGSQTRAFVGFGLTKDYASNEVWEYLP